MGLSDGEGRSDAEVLEAAGAALYAAISPRLGPYVAEAVRRQLEAAGRPIGAREVAAGTAAARRAEARVLPALRELLSADVDAQASTPLSLVRRALDEATAALDELAVDPPARDRFLLEAFPADHYGLYPASIAVFGSEVEELAITWGAAKAMAHRRRHQNPQR
ncbi:MAG: hypothetical protein M0004_07985 [Actinomycetota bacterium]|nr:hypothetical protein [Actinomycetota bacterium]